MSLNFPNLSCSTAPSFLSNRYDPDCSPSIWLAMKKMSTRELLLSAVSNGISEPAAWRIAERCSNGIDFGVNRRVDPRWRIVFSRLARESSCFKVLSLNVAPFPGFL